MAPTSVIDAEIAAARKARADEKAERLLEARRIVEAFERLAQLDPSVAGMALDAMPRSPAPGRQSPGGQ